MDEGKIAIAQEVLGGGNQEFRLGNALDFSRHSGDIVMLDVLHYFSDDDQQQLLKKIATSIAPHAIALIRIALNEPNLRFAATEVEEWFVRLSGWIPQRGANFPTRDEVLLPFKQKDLVDDIRPMLGLTPFNSYLLSVRRKG